MELQEAVQHLRHDMTQEHGQDHIVDAEALAVVLTRLEASLETGTYCNLCGWYESEPDVEGATCQACGCEKAAHVPAMVVALDDHL